MPCSPRMIRCKVSCLHRARIEEYYLQRIDWEQRREAVAGDWVAEQKDFEAANPRPTLKAFLIGTAATPPPVEVAPADPPVDPSRVVNPWAPGCSTSDVA